MERPANEISANCLRRNVRVTNVEVNKNPLVGEGIIYKAFDNSKSSFSLDGRLGFSLGLDSLQWVFRIKNGFHLGYENQLVLVFRMYWISVRFVFS
jgi:hypothetical protein